MTVVRYILLATIAFSPLTAGAQNFTSAQSALSQGRGTPAQPGAIFGETFNPEFLTESEFEQQQNSQILLMQGAGPPPNSQPQPEPMLQQEVPSEFAHPNRHYTSPVWQASTKGGYFGIMGAVAQPGVYFAQEQHITLSDLLKLAGGASPAAGGGVRIVRQGRGGMQTFLSPDSKYEIMNGDVVLLEAQRAQVKTGLREYPKDTPAGGTVATSNATSSKLPPLAQLAFVNLQPQPIVVPVPSDQATLVSVMKWLHQDGESPPFVRVIAPNPVLRQNSSRPVDQQLLESGTVLVFDPATVKRERLPAFPPVIGLKAPAEGPPSPVPPREVISQPPLAGDAVKILPPAPRQLRPVPSAKPLRAPQPSTTQRGPPAQMQHLGQTRQGNAPAEDFSEVPHQGGSPTGGPLLMMPQTNRPQRSQATAPGANSRRALPPKPLKSQDNHASASAYHEVERMSWQPRPGVRANADQPEVGDQGVVQAHVEESRIADEFAGPALELPNAVPKLVAADPIVALQPAPEPKAAVAPKFAPATFSMQVVWFSVGSMLLLVVGLWCLSRWDAPRPIRAAITAGHFSRFRAPSSPAHGATAPPLGLRILKPTGKPLAEAPLPMPAVAPAAPQPVRVDPPVPATSPGPARTISQEEQRLRAHFREARQLRVVAAETTQIPEPQASVVAPPSTKVSQEELRQLSGRTPIATGKILAQIPTVTTPKVAATERTPTKSGSMLDRILRAQQKR